MNGSGIYNENTRKSNLPKWFFIFPVAMGLMFSAGMCVGTLRLVDKNIMFALSRQAKEFHAALAERDRDILELQKSYGSLRMDLYTEWAKGLSPAKKAKGKK
jgi:hypothetical protein